MRSRAHNIKQNVGNLSLCLATVSLLFSVTSCRKEVVANNDSAPARSTADVIAEADALYAGRSDLTKVRQGLIALRHSQATEAENYNVAWRVAKFDYYLGSHTPDETERDKAFREGIEAGKLALKLQDGKPDGHFWLGANYGGKAEVSTLAGLAEIDDIKHEMEVATRKRRLNISKRDYGSGRTIRYCDCAWPKLTPTRIARKMRVEKSTRC